MSYTKAGGILPAGRSPLPLIFLLLFVFTGLHHLSHSLWMQSHYSANGRLFLQGISPSVLTVCQ